MAKVSIVTSVYNKEPWLARFFESVLKQTFSDLEIIVVDNASTDNSSEIIKSYANKDSRIRAMTLKENVGPGGGVSVAIDEVTSPYFAICDSDDYIERNYIEVLYNKIIENDAEMAMCTNDMVWDDGTVRNNKKPGKDLLFTNADVSKLLPQLLDHHSNKYLGYYLAELGVKWGKLYRTDIIRRNNLNYSADDWLWDDWIFNFKFYKKMNKMIYTEDTKYHFYQALDSVTSDKKMNWKKLNQITVIVNKFYDESVKIMTDQLKTSLSRFYYLNLCMLLDMYISYYPNPVNKKCLNEFCDAISKWKGLEGIKFSNRKGLTYKQYLKYTLIKKHILSPFIIKKHGKLI